MLPQNSEVPLDSHLSPILFNVFILFIKSSIYNQWYLLMIYKVYFPI